MKSRKVDREEHKWLYIFWCVNMFGNTFQLYRDRTVKRTG